jgi:peptidoglycan/LPS O-acetylase OafA/YrhL
MGIEHLRSIDAVRGWAIFGVIVAHVSTMTSAGPLEPLAQLGLRGVQLFFIASALTLFMSFHQRKSEAAPIRNYFIRRFFRIAPLYYLACALWLAYLGTGPNGAAPSGVSQTTILLTPLFLNGWHPEQFNAIVPGGWSIVVEMNFYFLLPILVAGVTSLRSALIVGGVISALGVAVSVVGYGLAPYIFPEATVLARSFFGNFWLPVSLPAFMFGMTIYFANRDGRWNVGQGVLLSAIGLMLGLAYMKVPLKNLAVTPLLAIFVVGLIQLEPRALVNPAICFLGRVSYSAYFVHIVVGEVVATSHTLLPLRGNFAVACPVILITTGLLSYLTWRVVELPGQNLGRAIIKQLEMRPVKSSRQGRQEDSSDHPLPSAWRIWRASTTAVRANRTARGNGHR